MSNPDLQSVSLHKRRLPSTHPPISKRMAKALKLSAWQAASLSYYAASPAGSGISVTNGDVKSWRRFLDVPPAIRTCLSSMMIYIENTIEFLMGLKPADLTLELQKKLPLFKTALEDIVHDLNSPYFDNGSLSILGLERLQNQIFRASKGSVIRININMTDANTADKTDRLGNAFKYAVLTLLKKEFGRTNVSLNPEGTSFLVAGVEYHKVTCSMGRFEREVLIMLRRKDIMKRFSYSSETLEKFRPIATAFFMLIDGSGLNIKETVSSKDRKAILMLQARIIGLLEESLRKLAVYTTAAEKCPDKIGLLSGLAVYDESQLNLLPGSPGYELLSSMQKLGAGYVPAGVYESAHFRTYKRTDKPFATHPRPAHAFGQLDHPKRPMEKNQGGAFQVLEDAIDLAVKAKTPAEKQEACDLLHRAARHFRIALNIGETARRNARNPLMIKWIQEIDLHDNTRFDDYYFVESVFHFSHDDLHVIAVEIDSFKAFAEAHELDDTDSLFWGVFDSFIEVAEELSLPLPVLTQFAGDSVVAALPVKDKSDRPIDVAMYTQKVQARVKEKYAAMEFQDFVKVDAQNGGNGNGKALKTARMPLWQEKSDPSKISHERNKLSDPIPYMRTLSITAVAATVNKPKSLAELKTFRNIVHEMSKKTKLLKDAHWPEKGAFEMMSFPRSETLKVEQVSRPGIRRLRRAISSQLHSAWGNDWREATAGIRDLVVDKVIDQAPELSPVIMPYDVGAGVALAGFSSLSALSPPAIFLPPIVGVR